MIAMAVAMGFGRFVYTPILPGMMDELGLSAANAGLIASANFLGYLVGALLAAGGWAHGRERPIFLVSLGASALLSGMMGLTDSIAIFLIVRFLAGLVSAFAMVFVSATVFSHLALARREDLQAMHFGGVGLGIAVSSAMMAVLIVQGAAWPAGWLGSAALSACGFVIVWLMLDQGPVVTGEARREPKLPKSTALAKMIAAYGIFGFGYVITATFLVAIIRQGDSGPVFEAIVWLATGLAGIPSIWLWNKVVARIGLASAFAFSCVVEAVGVAASVTIGGYTGPLIAGVLLGGTFIAVTAMGLQAGRRLAPLSPRRILALMTASFGLGQIIGPIFSGIVAEWTGGFVVPSLVAAASLLVCAGIAWSARASTDSPQFR
ncbi:YbfB/YjiJ family MFS transporter [Mesorhizobium sp. SB112]|uniref:YbfB/YjiJ family MFS transporter n=1 Tax=Mesorhizobium sp. SB112 TaxID=3151853 RepID=UPI003265DEA2